MAGRIETGLMHNAETSNLTLLNQKEFIATKVIVNERKIAIFCTIKQCIGGNALTASPFSYLVFAFLQKIS